jgi:dihydrofolate reductase
MDRDGVEMAATERQGRPMGRIVANFFISLDGVVESPENWHFAYHDDQMEDAIDRAAAAYDAFLMGRVLYEQWADFWPNQGDEMSFASFIDNVPKYVVSNTLDEATWNNTTILSGDVATQLKELKESTSGDIGMSGSATLVRWLLANGLLDELALTIHPIAVGRGQRLFEDTPTHPLRLVRHETFDTGVLNVAYVPDPAAPSG